MAQKKKDETKDVLEVLFPGKELEIAKGEVVIMKPLSLEDLTKVIDAFNTVAEMYAKGQDAGTIVLTAMKEVLLLLSYCIDRPINEIPAKYTPDLVETFVEQNLDDVTLAKWTTLVQKFASELQGIELLGKKVIKSQGLGNISPKE